MGALTVHTVSTVISTDVSGRGLSPYEVALASRIAEGEEYVNRRVNEYLKRFAHRDWSPSDVSITSSSEQLTPTTRTIVHPA